MCPFDDKLALIQIMACHRAGDKPLFEPRMTWFIDAFIRYSVSTKWNKLLYVDTCARLHNYIKHLCAALFWKKWTYIGIMHKWFNDWISSDNAVNIIEKPQLEPIYLPYTCRTNIIEMHVSLQSNLWCEHFCRKPKFNIWCEHFCRKSIPDSNLNVCIDFKYLYDPLWAHCLVLPSWIASARLTLTYGSCQFNLGNNVHYGQIHFINNFHRGK